MRVENTLLCANEQFGQIVIESKLIPTLGQMMIEECDSIQESIDQRIVFAPKKYITELRSRTTSLEHSDPRLNRLDDYCASHQDIFNFGRLS